MIAGYDPKDEFTALSVGRTPRTPYLEATTARSLAGLRIGVVREYMNRKLLTQADEESIDIVERAIEELRKLGATVVDPGPEGALFQRASRVSAPELLCRGVHAAVPTLFPVDAAGQPQGDQIATLLEMRADPSRVPGGADAAQPRRRVRRAGRRQVHDQPLPARARRREHQDQRRSDRQGDVLQRSELPEPASRARAGRARDRAGYVGAPAHALRAADAAAAVHAGAEARRAGGADVHRAAAEAAVTARAGEQRPHADRLVDVRSAGLPGHRRAGWFHDRGLGPGTRGQRDAARRSESGEAARRRRFHRAAVRRADCCSASRPPTRPRRRTGGRRRIWAAAMIVGIDRNGHRASEFGRQVLRSLLRKYSIPRREVRVALPSGRSEVGSRTQTGTFLANRGDVELPCDEISPTTPSLTNHRASDRAFIGPPTLMTQGRDVSAWLGSVAQKPVIDQSTRPGANPIQSHGCQSSVARRAISTAVRVTIATFILCPTP